MENEQSFFQDPESFFRTMRTEKSDNFILSKCCSNFETYEIPPGVYEVFFIKSTLDYLGKANVFIDTTTLKSKAKTNNVLRFIGKFFLITILELRPNWVYEHYNEDISQNKIFITTIFKFNSSAVVEIEQHLV